MSDSPGLDYALAQAGLRTPGTPPSRTLKEEIAAYLDQQESSMERRSKPSRKEAKVDQEIDAYLEASEGGTEDSGLEYALALAKRRKRNSETSARIREDKFAGLTAGVKGQDDWKPQSVRDQRSLFESKPQPQTSLGRMATALPGPHQALRLLPAEDLENITEGVTSAIGGTVKQLANAAQLLNPATYLGQHYPDGGFSPVPSLRQTEQMHQMGTDIQSAVAENEAKRPQPTTFTGQVRRGVGRGLGTAMIELPKLIAGGRVLGAANLPVQGSLSQAEEGLPGIIKGAAGGLVYHYGGQITGRYLGKLGNSLVWIAGPTAEQQIEPRLTGAEAPALGQSLGENIPIGLFAGVGGARKSKAPGRQTVSEATHDKPRGSEQVRVRENGVERIALRKDLPKILTKQLEVVPPREAWEELSGIPESVRSQPRFRIEGTKLIDAFDEMTKLERPATTSAVVEELKPVDIAKQAEPNALARPEPQTEGGIIQMNAGLNPLQAFRETDRVDLGPADLVQRGIGTQGSAINPTGSFTVQRKPKDYSTWHKWFFDPLSSPGLKGAWELLAGEKGRQASDAFIRTQRVVIQRVHDWQHSVESIGLNLKAAMQQQGIPLRGRKGLVHQEKFVSDFIDLVELPYSDARRMQLKASDTPLGRALSMHDKLTDDWLQYIRHTREQLAIPMPKDWGITEGGYYRHLFIGDTLIFVNGRFEATAKNYAEAQKFALDHLQKDPHAQITARGRLNAGPGDLVRRLTDRGYWKLASNLTGRIKSRLSGDVEFGLTEFIEDARGIIGRKSMQMKFAPYGQTRQGFKNFSREYEHVMNIHAQQLARTQELSKLNREIQPIIEHLKSSHVKQTDSVKVTPSPSPTSFTDPEWPKRFNVAWICCGAGRR